VADLVAVRESIASQVAANALPSLSTSAEYLDTINVPMLLVIPRPPVARFAVCMGESVIEPDGKPMSPVEFTISGFLAIARADTVANVQDNLDIWLGTLNTATSVSVEQAIAMDPTLGGTVEWCITTIVDGYGPIEWAGAMYFGARFNWHVSAR
jgi:hypothetical protein